VKTLEPNSEGPGTARSHCQSISEPRDGSTNARDLGSRGEVEGRRWWRRPFRSKALIALRVEGVGGGHADLSGAGWEVDARVVRATRRKKV